MLMVELLKKLRAVIDCVFAQSMGVDGAEHLVAGIVVVSVAMWVMPAVCAVAFTLIVLGAKELVYDKWLGHGTAEWRDFLWGCLGMLLGLM